MKSMDELIEVVKAGYMEAEKYEMKTEDGSTIIPIKVFLPDDLVISSGTIARHQDKTVDDFIREALENRVAYYVSRNATGVWKDGVYLPNRTPLQIEDAARKGVKLDEERIPCKVVGRKIIYGEPYFQILLNGNFMSVPEAQVEVIANESLIPEEERVI